MSFIKLAKYYQSPAINKHLLLFLGENPKNVIGMRDNFPIISEALGIKTAGGGINQQNEKVLFGGKGTKDGF